jgi:hypothetical protein
MGVVKGTEKCRGSGESFEAVLLHRLDSAPAGVRVRKPPMADICTWSRSQGAEVIVRSVEKVLRTMKKRNAW